MKLDELERLAELCINNAKKQGMIWNNRFELTKFIIDWTHNYMRDKYKLSI